MFNCGFPFIARHVPVQLVVIVEESQRIEHAITKNDRARRIIRIRHVDFEFCVASLPALLVLERLAGVVRDAERFEK